jgi:pyridoxine 5-phosphate synthase
LAADRDIGQRDIGQRDIGHRDIGQRDIGQRDIGPSRYRRRSSMIDNPLAGSRCCASLAWRTRRGLASWRPMIRLSVNVNKVATLRNSRGGVVPSVVRAAETCLEAGAHGITVHPRADQRHIRPADVTDVAAVLARWRQRGSDVEFNIEGDPRPDFVDLVLSTRPDQCTLVPVVPGEITSQAGWPADTSPERVGAVIRRLQAAGIRVSLFVDPGEAPVRWAARLGANRIELYTEPFASAFARGEAPGRQSFAGYAAAAGLAHSLGLGLNAGHDLDLDNLQLFRTLPHLDEVSIGHALISHALWVGLDRSVRDFLDAISGSRAGLDDRYD